MCARPGELRKCGRPSPSYEILPRTPSATGACNPSLRCMCLCWNGPMPRYFIDTDDNDSFVEDDEGQDLPDVEAARELAQAALPDMARDKIPDGDCRTFCASVRDEAGTVIYKATLSLHGEWKTDRPTS